MIKNLLIVGANGFLGSNLVNFLSNKKLSITCLCKKKIKKEARIKNLKYIFSDLTNYQDLKKKLKKDNLDCVINLSGNIDHSNKNQNLKVHYQGLKNLIKVFRRKKIKLFIQIGSSLEYGNKKSPQAESVSCNPHSDYGKAKYKATLELLKDKSNFNKIILRPYQIYGPNQKKNRLIPFVIDSCIKNKNFLCTEGVQKRDFLYVDDFSNLIFKILKNKKVENAIYNVGSGIAYSIKKIIILINKTLKKGNPIFGKLKMRKDEILELYPNINLIKKKFNWSPKVSLYSGLKKTILHYKCKQ